MNYINKKQLAFILEIPSDDARAKMCVAWAKHKGITNTARWERAKTKTGKESERFRLIDAYPDAMDVEMLSIQLNLPNLVQAVSDIETGYLKRPAAKKWILCDFPEKKLKEAEKKLTLSIPPGLKSMLPTEVITEIQFEWSKRYPTAIIK